MGKIIAKLKILLPKTFPIAISGLPILKALRHTVNSGRDVATAKNRLPTKLLSQCIAFAIPLQEKEASYPAIIINSAEKMPLR